MYVNVALSLSLSPPISIPALRSNSLSLLARGRSATARCAAQLRQTVLRVLDYLTPSGNPSRRERERKKDRERERGASLLLSFAHRGIQKQNCRKTRLQQRERGNRETTRIGPAASRPFPPPPWISGFRHPLAWRPTALSGFLWIILHLLPRKRTT